MSTVTQVAVPFITGAIGVAGGVLLGRTALHRNPKILGVRVPSVKVDLANVSKQVGAAAKQFGRLANEVQQAREKAEQLGRAIT
jgi:hypothetical protein